MLVTALIFSSRKWLVYSVAAVLVVALIVNAGAVSAMKFHTSI
jgi:uncharacterized membrane protein YqhA